MPRTKITKDLLEVRTIREDGYEDVEHVTRKELELERAKILPQKEHHEVHAGYISDRIAKIDELLAVLDK